MMKKAFLVASILALSASPALGANDQTPEEKRNTQIIVEVFDALESGALEPINRYFKPDGATVLGLEERVRGAPRATFQEAAPFPGALENVSVKIEHILAEGDKVAVQSLICGDHTKPLLGFEPTGKQVCSRYLNLYILEDGLIVNNSVGVHRDQLRAQLEANAAQ
ncbi:MAG: ester cyclase [Pseudomonadota bacterium]